MNGVKLNVRTDAVPPRSFGTYYGAPIYSQVTTLSFSLGSKPL